MYGAGGWGYKGPSIRAWGPLYKGVGALYKGLGALILGAGGSLLGPWYDAHWAHIYLKLLEITPKWAQNSCF